MAAFACPNIPTLPVMRCGALYLLAEASCCIICSFSPSWLRMSASEQHPPMPCSNSLIRRAGAAAHCVFCLLLFFLLVPFSPLLRAAVFPRVYVSVL